MAMPLVTRPISPGGLARREEDGREEVLRLSPHGGDVVRVHLDGVPADALGEEGYGIGGEEEIVIAAVDSGRIFAHRGPDFPADVVDGKPRKKLPHRLRADCSA